MMLLSIVICQQCPFNNSQATFMLMKHLFPLVVFI